MPRHWIKMHDFWTVKSKQVIHEKKQHDAKNDGNGSLLVRVAATHSGIINGNMRFYRPDRMVDGTHTWIAPTGQFARPILIGHDEQGAVVGRVVEAKYIDESYLYKSKYTQLRDSVFYAADSRKKTDLFKTIDWIVENLMVLEDYKGLGYIELGLKVTNPEAVDKISREEFLTVSVGFKTDSAICSVCHTDWAVDDRCDHKLGEPVDGKPMFLISGQMEFEEVSFVNFPADPFAGVVSKEKLADGLARMKPFFLGLSVKQQSALTKASGLQMTDSLYDADIQIVEDKMPASNDPNTPVVTPAEDELTAALQTEESACDLDQECAPTIESIEEADREFFNDEEGLYTELVVEIDAAVAAGEISQDSVKDAKLSSEQRKKLKSSTFCGPNRSFPVPDCAHVTAARRLLGRAKVSADTKAKISACVSRKAKSLGCGDAKKDAAPVVETVAISDALKPIVDRLKIADGKTGEKLLKALNGLDEVYRSVEDDDSKQLLRAATSQLVEAWYADSYLAYIKGRLEEKDFIVLSKDEVASQQAAAATAAQEKALGEVNGLKDQVSKLLANFKRSLASQIVIAKVQSGAEGFKGLTSDQIKSKVEELAKRHVSSLKDSVADILLEVKLIDSIDASQSVREPAPEANTTVTDNTQVVEPAAAKSEKDEAEKVAAAKELELHNARLAAMTPRERRIYLSDLTYRTSAKKPGN
jgi:hypothetical protein